jgi:PAS domain-containing protein
MSRAWVKAENIESTPAEEALRESPQLLQQVLATMPVGVAVTDQVIGVAWRPSWR